MYLSLVRMMSIPDMDSYEHKLCRIDDLYRETGKENWHRGVWLEVLHREAKLDNWNWGACMDKLHQETCAEYLRQES